MFNNLGKQKNTQFFYPVGNYKTSHIRQQQRCCRCHRDRGGLPTDHSSTWTRTRTWNRIYRILIDQWIWNDSRNCLCSLVSNPDQTSYYHCWAGCCECATAVQFFKVTELLFGRCKGVRCPPIFSLSNLINAGWLVRMCINIHRGVNPYGTEGTRPPQYLGWGGLQWRCPPQ